MKRRLERTGPRGYVDTQGLAAFLTTGTATAARIGKAAGAEIRLGGRLRRYSLERVRAYLENEGGQATNEKTDP